MDAVPSSCLCSTLRQTVRAVTRRYDEALRPAKLRITQYTVLTYLMALGESRVRDLGAAMVLEETTLTRNLALLERAGWVESRPGADRRERLVSITAAGRRTVEKARPLWQAAQEAMKERLSRTAWDGIFRALPRVVEASHA
jgi:DNA-binding MarR family transcriptional regulator